MKALILCAGYATRLYPLTKDRPKSLLPVGKKPMIEYILERVEEIEDIDKVYIVTNGKFSKHFRRWGEGYQGKKQLKIINDETFSDDEKLGAIGDIKFVIDKEKINDELLIIGGDNLFDFSLTDFIRFFNIKKRATVALYNVDDREEIKKYSVVTLNSEKRIVGFEEKPENPVTTLIAICMYIFPEKELGFVANYIKEGGNPDATGFYIAWLHRHRPVYGFTFTGNWYDIGDADLYRFVNKKYSESDQ
ncbi:nucleotidyltransferase family protein [candidate division NPL-UPA2 bacterium Unc8]|uniref:Nucleotidyltransferase family protein n=1 Tax=candidate division NPL-UPA2 bacterium Unc8 TaxID=1980939 RepID=A0A399FYZ9_UNCN2|nr:MAG: nucleotidyltransferase family protein [candidate division NPL-UPA2 bacterium Unc8]